MPAFDLDNQKESTINKAYSHQEMFDLALNYLRYEPKKYRRLRNELPRGIQADLDAINESLQKYPEIMPRLRYHAYDAYLKTQGIQEGMVNYNRVIMLAKAWRNARRM